MKDKVKILLVVAPNKMECHATAKAFDLDFLKAEGLRFISHPYHLRGWSRGTPFIAQNRFRWPEDFDQVLQVLTMQGQLRIANDLDLADLRHEPLFVSPPCVGHSLGMKDVRA
jgi:hypothetical protein